MLILIALAIFVATWEIVAIFAESTEAITPEELEKLNHPDEYLNQPLQSELNIYTILTLIILATVVVLKLVISNTDFFRRKDFRAHSTQTDHLDTLDSHIDLLKEVRDHKSILNDLCVRLEVMERLFDDHVRHFRRSGGERE